MPKPTKGKGTDRSTAWSPHEWNPQIGCWVASRLNPSGEAEFDYRRPENLPSPPDENSIPRFPGPSVINSSDIYSPTTSGGTAYGPENIASYTTATASTVGYGGSSGYGALPTWNTQGTYPLPGPNSSSSRFPSVSTVSYSMTPNTSGLYATNQNYPTPRQPYQAPFTEDDVAQSFNSMAITSPLTSPQAYAPISSPQGGMKISNPPPNSENYEELDPRYKVVDESNQRKFWKIGRVFMVLWTEPARSIDLNSVGGPTTTTSQFNQIYLKGTVFSEIRRFVVVGEGYGNCMCSPIHTYNGQATLKPNLPEPLQHAIIYTSDQPPPEHRCRTSDGNVMQENLIKDPIKVVSEQTGPEGDLGALSRLNYSKVYTVEKYVRVLNVGMVDRDSIQALCRNSFVKPREDPIEKPRKRPSRTDSHQADRRGKGNKKDKDGGRKNR